ncbi:MAG: ATP synthase F1 subunit epsilon [Lachnospiraceae bacterium]|nr:ATP synthase F1 subunit epsilon [Lachnospiraceae bacterium]
MKTFSLRIGTPDGLMFEGEVERIKCRSMTGDLAILADHTNYCTALGMGEATVVMPDGERRTAACIGGMITMLNGDCHLLATTWEWKEDIDIERAKAAKEKAEQMLADKNLSDRELRLAEAKLHRALVRIGVKE